MVQRPSSVFPPRGSASPDAACRQLLDHGYAIVKLPPDIESAANSIFQSAPTFFSPANRDGKTELWEERSAGYRPMGIERDATTGLPDLCESYTVWHRPGGGNESRSGQAKSFPEAMRNATIAYAAYASQLLAELPQAMGLVRDSSRDISIANASYLQLNHYPPPLAERPRLMEAHEDGHLLTLLTPTASGLFVAPGDLVQAPTADNPAGEFQVKAPYQPIELAKDEMIIMPGSPLYYLTGGRTPPLFHLVSKAVSHDRYSLMFFVNPTPDQRLRPWQASPHFGEIDVGKVVETMSTKYGLEALSTLLERATNNV